MRMFILNIVNQTDASFDQDWSRDLEMEKMR
jgi:hypothetical protein